MEIDRESVRERQREYSSKLIVMNEPAEWHAVLQQLKLGLVQILCLERVLARTVNFVY